MSQDTERQIGDIIARHCAEGSPPSLPGSTLKDLGIDSLNAIEILFDIEEHFGINLPDRDPEFDTGSLQGLVDAVDGALALKAGAAGAAPA